MSTKRELSSPGTKQKCEKLQMDKHEQVRCSRKNDKLKQWVMDWVVQVIVLGLILANKKGKVIFLVYMSL